MIGTATGATLSLGSCVTSLGGSPEDEIAAITNGLSTPIQLAGSPFRGMRLSERMAHYGVPGVSICRFRDGSIAWTREFGSRSSEAALPIAADTLFQAASISKPITAATVMCLADRGQLDIDADVRAYLGEWTIPREDGAGEGVVTLRMLLSHTAGVSVSGFRGYAPKAPLPSLDDIIAGRAPANSAPIRIVRAPAGQSEYSGGGYLIVQRIIERVSGRAFSEVARDCVLAPCGMTRSMFAQPLPHRYAANAAFAHDGEGRLLAEGVMVYPELAAAGLWSTPADLARFAMSYQRALSGKRGLMSSGAAQTMATRQSDIWAVGFELVGNEPWAVYHTGSNAGFKSFLLAEIGARNGVVVMTNGDNGASLFQEILAGMATFYGWPHLGPRQRTAVALDEQALGAFASTYHSREPIEADFVVASREGRLVVEVPGFVPATDFFPLEEDGFFDLTGSTIRFERDVSGEVSVLVWDGNVRAARVSR